MSRPTEWLRSIALVTAFVTLGCAPASPATTQTSALPSVTASAPKTLTIALQGEPKAIMTVLGGDVGGSPAGLSEHAFHQHLSVYNERGEVLPMLAAELPSQANGTWTLRPDGTMQTIYKLRSGVTWHDGAPLTARDVVFGWNVARDKDLPVVLDATLPITRIETPDDLTLVLEWSSPHPNADIITDWTVGPLPTHLLEATYQSDKELFQRLPYWNREFVGLGPYVLADWELGSHIIGKAYDGFYAGRAKIDTVVLKFIPNEPTAVANLLAGTVDGQFRALTFNQVMVVMNEWEKAGKKPVAIGQPLVFRTIDVQYRDQYRDPKVPELADVRVRRGLLQAIDRQALVDYLHQGQAPVAHTFISPEDVKWDWVKDAVTRYDYDPRRAQELLAEAGWRRGPDGTTVNAAGERVTLQLRTIEGGQWQDEIAITADHWKAIGLNVEQSIVPTAQSRDRMIRSIFPALEAGTRSLPLLSSVRSYYGPECRSEATRWAGNNLSCYQHPEADRIAGPLLLAIDRGEQQRLTQALVRHFTQELPSLPLYFTVQMFLFREGITGARGGGRPVGSNTWNIYEWDVV